MRTTPLVAVVLVLIGVVGVAAPTVVASQQVPAQQASGQQAAAQQAPAQQASAQQAAAYSGTHLTFDTGENSVVDYTVNGEAIVRNLSVQSKSKAQRQGGIGTGASLSAVTKLSGARVSSTATARTNATVGFASGAEMAAHDNGRGVFVVRSGGQSQYVEVGISSGSGAEQSGEKRVVVTSDNGTNSVFLVVGAGQVTVNEAGNVTAEIGKNGSLVYRQYTGERDGNDKKQERFITDGKATAAVYIQQTGQDGRKRATDVVQYSQETTVDVTRKSKGTVEMTVDRTKSEGSAILCTVSNNVFESTEDIRVRVDGEAAAEANSYSGIGQSVTGGADSNSTYLVHPSSSAGATADVVVGINHFSQRSVTMTSDTPTATQTATDTEDGMGGDGDQPTDGGVPGFGPLTAVLAGALVAMALYARRRY